MLISALTGGIATGKSAVTMVLSDLGCYIHEADKEAHKLISPKTPEWEKIVSRYGHRILTKNGHIDRRKLGKIVFSHKEELNFLNRLIHPQVLENLIQTIKQIQQMDKYKIFVSEAAVVIESGFVKYFEKIIVVHCNPDVQIQRLMNRDGITREEALVRINSQITNAERMKYADYSINSSGTIEETIEQSERVYRNLLSDYCLKQQKAEDRKPEDRR